LLNIILLNVILLSIILQGVVLLNVILLSVILMNVSLINVILLSVILTSVLLMNGILLSVILISVILLSEVERLPLAEGEDDLWLGADVLHGRGSSPDLSPQNVVEDVDGILLALEVDPVEVGQDQQQQAGVVRLLHKFILVLIFLSNLKNLKTLNITEQHILDTNAGKQQS
jgi:hypothetical protein